MKRMIGLFTRKVAVAIMLVLCAMVTNARVFWNKVEVNASPSGMVTLNWNVTEYNNKMFHIQRSTDGINWETLAVVESKNSAQTMTDYSYSYRNKFTGKQYYRLQDTDIDVAYSSFSPVKTLVLKNENTGVSIWPNPSSDRITIESNDDNVYAKATIFNLMGKVMAEKALNAHVTEISVSKLTAGTYILKLETIAGTSQTQKFIKQ